MSTTLRAWTLNGMDRFGINTITEVQKELLLCSGDHTDCLVQSRAGTGKTTAIGILISETHQKSSSSLVIVPNETLALQIELDLRKMLSHSMCVVRALSKVLSEKIPVRSGTSPHHHLVIIADIKTVAHYPGFLSGLRPQHIFLDEADELFDDALHMESAEVLQSCLGDAKTMFFSATFPPFIVTRIEEALVSADPDRDVPHHIKLCVSTSVDAAVNAVVPHVRKYYTVVADEEVVNQTTRLIQETLKPDGNRMVVFGGSRKQADFLYQALLNEGILACSIRSHFDNYGNARVILDPHGYLSRGVNIPGLDIGISIGIPIQKETILHQWGRIAREGQEGHFYHIVTAEELDQLNFLSFQLGVDFEEYNLPNPTSRHPFEIHSSTEDRMRQVIQLIERYS
jgi:superfamily II DNA/RNA helicase